ncbi:DUF550 domain-containing protein [Salmonella enterica]|nr:DUF550 domain-containing protein [Salmonella enterica]
MTITKERLLKIQHWREIYGADSNVMLPAEEAEELARIALAALEAEKGAEPVAFINGAWTLVYYRPPKELGLKIGDKLYTAHPASERERIRREHAEWSNATFGNVGPVGPLKHLSKEALEAAADPSDPLEWADMQFLLWDAQRRMGISDEFITRAMVEKLAINKGRQWPEPKDGEPRLHIKEQSAPVQVDIEILASALKNAPLAPSDNQGRPRAPVVPPAIEPDYKVIKSILPTANPDEYACCIAADMWNACRAAMLQGVEQPQNARQNIPENIPDGNSPAIPDDWVMVPKEPTQAMIKAWLSEVANFRGHAAGYRAALAAAPQQEMK